MTYDVMQVGVPVAIVLGLFKIIELLISKVGNGGSPLTKDQARQIQAHVETLDRAVLVVTERLVAVSRNLELLAEEQEKVTASLVRHELTVHEWLAKGCPNSHTARDLLQLSTQILQQVEKKGSA